MRCKNKRIFLYVTLKKLRSFTQKIPKFLYVKLGSLPETSSLIQDDTNVELSYRNRKIMVLQTKIHKFYEVKVLHFRIVSYTLLLYLIFPK